MDYEQATDVFAGRQSPPLEGTASAALSIERVKYSHDAMIDMIIASPGIAQGAIAKHFGYTQAWVSRIFNSDAFQARLAQRKNDLVDPSLLLSIDERLRVLADRSLSILHEKLELTQNPDLAIKAAELSVKALGYGARQNNVAIQQNFVVAMPQKAASPEAWAALHSAPQVVQERSPELARMVAEVQDLEVKGDL